MDNTNGAWGPSSPSLWLTRTLGHWERQIIKDWPIDIPGPRHCTCNNVTHITGTQEINLVQWKNAVKATVYQEPSLRTNVDVDQEPPIWIPATDFSQVFSFRDLRGIYSRQGGCLAGVWHLLEDEANKPLDYGSGKPLYHHTLLRVDDGYVVMNCYHHAVGDGFSGMLIMMSILKKYQMLLDGNEAENITPLQPLDSIEQMAKNVSDPGGVVEKMINGMMNRVAHYKPILPMDLEELKTNKQMDVPINRTLHREGSTSNYSEVTERCRREGVTVGALMLAATYMTKLALYASLNPDWVKEKKLILIDIAVNLRDHVEPAIGNRYVGCNFGVMTSQIEDVTPSVCLWDLARQLGTQMNSLKIEKQHLLFNGLKEKIETNEETAKIAASVAPECRADVFYSNVGKYPGPLVQSWGGKVKSVNFVLSYATPGIANYMLLVHSADIFTYNLIHCPGPTNTHTANQFMDILAELMEGAGKLPGPGITLEDVILGIN